MWDNFMIFYLQIYLSDLIIVSNIDIIILAQLISYILFNSSIIYSFNLLEMTCNYYLFR